MKVKSKTIKLGGCHVCTIKHVAELRKVNRRNANEKKENRGRGKPNTKGAQRNDITESNVLYLV